MTHLFRRPRRLALAALALLLPACVFSPRTVEFDDPDCQGVRREMVLDQRVLDGYQACRAVPCDEGAVLLGVLGSAASLVVAGSVYVVGNVVYWVEKQVQCKPT